MEPKKNLNNVQRNMLDKLYSEQFETKIRQYQAKRSTEREDLVNKILADERRVYAKMLAMGQRFYDWTVSIDKELKSKNLTLGYHTNPPKLELASGYQTDKRPELEAFDKKTSDVIDQLNQKRNEMRTRIFGLTTTYDDIEKELKSLLSGVKV